jgi:hypothetical protein
VQFELPPIRHVPRDLGPVLIAEACSTPSDQAMGDMSQRAFA